MKQLVMGLALMVACTPALAGEIKSVYECQASQAYELDSSIGLDKSKEDGPLRKAQSNMVEVFIGGKFFVHTRTGLIIGDSILANDEAKTIQIIDTGELGDSFAVLWQWGHITVEFAMATYSAEYRKPFVALYRHSDVIAGWCQ